MAQGKLKVKAKLPSSVKNKKAQKIVKAKKSNRPVLPRAKNLSETQKLKKVLLKSINENMEKELRSKASISLDSKSRKNKTAEKPQSRS